MERSAVIVQFAALVATAVALVAGGDFSAAATIMVAAQSLLLTAAAYNAYNRHMGRAYYLRADLLFPLDAPYWRVIQGGNDGAYWQLLRTNKATFDLICERVDSRLSLWRDGYADAHGGRRRGRPNMLDARSVIALTMAWLGSSGPNNRLLEQIFGIGHSVTDRDLHKGLRALNAALTLIPEARVTWPSPAKMREYDEMFTEAHGANPYAPHAIFFGSADCLRITVAEPTDDDEQNALYNGWIHCCNRNNFLVSAPDGTFVWASIGHKGTTHDSVCARDTAGLLLDRTLTPQGAVLFTDSGFASTPTNDIFADRFAYKPPAAAVDPNPRVARQQTLAFQRLQRKSRQLSEHNNRTLQAVWRRLTKMPWRPDIFNLIMETCVMLHNLNARHVPHSNQSATLYMETYLRP